MKIEGVMQEFCAYSHYFRGVSHTTIQNYKNIISFFARSAEIEFINQVDEINVRQFFVDGRIMRGWKASTFIMYHKNLGVFFTWCTKQGFMTKNFCEDLETPRQEKPLPKALSKQQAYKILEITYNYPYPYKFLRYRNHAILAVFIFAGLRKQELLNLSFADVDLDNHIIHVNLGKGKKSRKVPMAFRLVEILRQYVKERHRLNRTCPEFFTSLNRNRGLGETGLKRIVVHIRTVSKIYFTPHVLRHTCATLHIEGGTDILFVQKLLGHSSVKTTSIYVASTVEHMREQVLKHPLNFMNKLSS